MGGLLLWKIIGCGVLSVRLDFWNKHLFPYKATLKNVGLDPKDQPLGPSHAPLP